MPTYKTKKGTIKSKPISKPAQKLLGMKPIRKKASGGKVATPKTKTQAFADYKKKHGHHHKADPKHPMNSERTGPLRKSGGGKTKKKVPAPKPLSKAMREEFEKNLSYENMVAPEKGSFANPAKNSKVLQKKAFNKTLKENPQAVKRLNEMKKKSKAMKSGGKLKMVEKGGKKVPFYAADGVGKMASGGPVKVKSGDTLSQIAKSKGVTLKALLAANPNIKNANQIRVGQSIKIPGAAAGAGAKSKNPYKGMSQTQMNMMDVKNKDRGKQEAVTRAMRTQVKSGGAPTSPSSASKKKIEDRSGTTHFNKVKKRVKKANSLPTDTMKKDTRATKKRRPAIPSNDIAAKKGGMMKAKGYKHGGMVRGAGAATKGKRFGRCG